MVIISKSKLAYYLPLICISTCMFLQSKLVWPVAKEKEIKTGGKPDKIHLR